MKIRIGILLLALGLGGLANAELTTVVRAIEASTSNMIVPTSANARLNFKACSSKCDAEYLSVRLTPATIYEVNGMATDFAGFRKAFNNLSRGEDHYALVSFDAKSNTATSVAIAD